MPSLRPPASTQLTFAPVSLATSSKTALILGKFCSSIIGASSLISIFLCVTPFTIPLLSISSSFLLKNSTDEANLYLISQVTLANSGTTFCAVPPFVMMELKVCPAAKSVSFDSSTTKFAASTSAERPSSG